MQVSVSDRIKQVIDALFIHLQTTVGEGVGKAPRNVGEAVRGKNQIVLVVLVFVLVFVLVGSIEAGRQVFAREDGEEIIDSVAAELQLADRPDQERDTLRGKLFLAQR